MRRRQRPWEVGGNGSPRITLGNRNGREIPRVTNDGIVQTYCLVIIFSVYSVMVLIQRPWRHQGMDVFDAISNITLVITAATYYMYKHINVQGGHVSGMLLTLQVR